MANSILSGNRLSLGELAAVAGCGSLFCLAIRSLFFQSADQPRNESKNRAGFEPASGRSALRSTRTQYPRLYRSCQSVSHTPPIPKGITDTVPTNTPFHRGQLQILATSHPQPLGALSPIQYRIALFTDVRAAILFFRDGLRNPSFMRFSPPNRSGILGISQNPTHGILPNI